MGHTIGGKSFETLEEVSKYYKYDYKLLDSYVKKHGFDKRIERTILDTCKYTVNGVYYLNLAQVAKEFNVKYNTLQSNVIKHRIENDITKAVNISVGNIYKIDGVWCATLREVATKLGVGRSKFYGYYSKYGLEKAVKIIKDMQGADARYFTADIDGMHFSSKAEVANYLGISVRSLTYYVGKYGLDDTIRRIKPRYIVNGVDCYSIVEVARELNVTYSKLQYALDKYDGNMKKAIKEMKIKSELCSEYVIDGVQYTSIADVARYLGYSRQMVHQYLKKYTFDECVAIIQENKAIKESKKANI